MEKLLQLMIALSEAVIRRLFPEDSMFTAPLATWAPVGFALAVGLENNRPSTAGR